MAPSELRKPRRTNEERRRESDNRLLDAGLRLVAQKGAAGATLADIGLAAGFSRSLPLERFGSKHQFLIALVDRTEEWFNGWAFADIEGKEGLEGLIARICVADRGAIGARLMPRTLNRLTGAPHRCPHNSL